jgi:hypothetical protein
LLLNARRPIPARQLAKKLEVDKDTGWYVTKRIQGAMLDPFQRELLFEIAEDVTTLPLGVKA